MPSAASDTEKEIFNTILGKVMDKQTKGELVVALELLKELSHVLYGTNVESETAHILMEDRNYVGWKSSDSDCPNFSQYLVQVQILVAFLERPAAERRPIIDLVSELSVSQTCGWDPSWDQGQKVCLNSYTTLNGMTTR
jgi:hypothetical protein